MLRQVACGHGLFPQQMQDLSPCRIGERLEDQIHISILSEIPKDVKRDRRWICRMNEDAPRCSGVLGGVLFAIPMLSLQVTYPHRRRKVVGSGPPPAIFAVFVVFGSAVTLAMLGYVLEGLEYSAAAFITALTIDFFTVIFGYLIALDVIMQQPMEVSERPTPH